MAGRGGAGRWARGACAEPAAAPFKPPGPARPPRAPPHHGVVGAEPGSAAGFRDAVPRLRLLQGREEQEHPRIRALDDVLDRLRPLHGHRDRHRHLPLLASFLLRGEDGLRHLAAVPVHPRLQPSLPQVRAPHAVPQGAGDRHLHHPGQGAGLRDHGAVWQAGPQHRRHRRGAGGRQEPGRAGRAAAQLQHAGPALPPRRSPRALPGPPVPGGAGEPQAAPGSSGVPARRVAGGLGGLCQSRRVAPVPSGAALRQRDGGGGGRGRALVGLAAFPQARPSPPGPQTPLPEPELARGEEEAARQRGLFPAGARPRSEEAGSDGAGRLI